jgi:hypothetical protein
MGHPSSHQTRSRAKHHGINVANQLGQFDTQHFMQLCML